MNPFGGTPAEWNALVAAMAEPHLLQSWEWSEVKQEHGWKRRPVLWDVPLRGSGPSAVAMLLERRGGLPALGAVRSLMYCPKGPLLDWHDAEVRTSVLDGLENEARKRSAIFCKLDAEIVVAKGVPGTVGYEHVEGAPVVLAQLRERGWRFSPDQIQFRNTVLLDLGLPEAALLERMKSKTRYNIGLAQRKGVKVRAGTVDDLGMLFRMYAQTSLRDGFAIRDETYYSAVWRKFMGQRRGDPELPWCEVLVADVDAEAVGAVFIFMFARRAYYLYGMSSERHREKMPNHLLQWEAIRLAKQRGCLVYDLWGAPDTFEQADRLWGVYRFKEGLGGSVVCTAGAWDYAPHRLQYALYTTLLPTAQSILRPLARRRLRQGLSV